MTVKQNLFILMMVCIGGYLSLFMTIWIGDSLKLRIMRLEVLAAQVHMEVLQARRQEKNFIIRGGKDVSEAVDGSLAKARKDLNEMVALFPAMKPQCTVLMDQMQLYQNEFAALNPETRNETPALILAGRALEPHMKTLRERAADEYRVLSRNIDLVVHGLVVFFVVCIAFVTLYLIKKFTIDNNSAKRDGDSNP